MRCSVLLLLSDCSHLHGPLSPPALDDFLLLLPSKNLLLSGLHEDLEQLERVIVKDYQQDAKSHKEKLMQNHRVRKRIDEMQDTAHKLVRAAGVAVGGVAAGAAAGVAGVAAAGG